MHCFFSTVSRYGSQPPGSEGTICIFLVYLKTFSISQNYTASDDRLVSNESKGSGRKWWWPTVLQHLPGETNKNQEKYL
jgi:hypothetical protein